MEIPNLSQSISQSSGSSTLTSACWALSHAFAQCSATPKFALGRACLQSFLTHSTWRFSSRNLMAELLGAISCERAKWISRRQVTCLSGNRQIWALDVLLHTLLLFFFFFSVSLKYNYSSPFRIRDRNCSKFWKEWVCALREEKILQRISSWPRADSGSATGLSWFLQAVRYRAGLALQVAF